MTFQVLDDEMRYVSTRSEVRPIDAANPNFKAMSDAGEGDYWVSHKLIVQSMTEATQEF